MARVDFYHLTRDPAPPVLAQLADRVLAAGHRLLVVAADAAACDAIDTALWCALPESFLPHTRADAPDAASDDPIIIAAALDDGGAANGASTVALADGEWRDAALGYDRTLYLFDGQCIDDARAAWRQLAARDGVERHYWQQDAQGKWRQGP